MDISNISLLKTVIGSDQEQITSAGKGDSFAILLKDSISKVNEVHEEADNALIEFAAKEGNSIHETMLAIAKADISFRMMMQVRNKIIDAYQEVMRMSV